MAAWDDYLKKVYSASPLKGLLNDPVSSLNNAYTDIKNLGNPEYMKNVRGMSLEDSKNIALDANPVMGAIVSKAVAKSINMPVTLPKSDEFLNAVKGTPNTSITPEGLNMSLVRFQKPEQELEQSVRNGVFYLPEGNANIKHYKNKGTLATGNPYGGNQQISGETLYKNPLFVKGATGGKAPEEAYKQLHGNDMFNKMTEAARSAASAPRHMKEEVAYKFLEVYAPELADNAWHIVQNSNQGNQLSYALQEAVIGNSARQKGYDAILGYSKGRGDKGNFLSEVFDLRESHYPSPSGEFYMNPEFESLLSN